VTAWKEANNDTMEQEDKVQFDNNVLNDLLSDWSVNLAPQDAGRISLARCQAVASRSSS